MKLHFVNKTKLTAAENSLQQTMSKAKLEFESSLINDFTFSNNNRIFKYISSFSKSDLMTLLPLECQF